MQAAHMQKMFDEAKYAIETGGLKSYAAMLGKYNGFKLRMMLGLLSYEPFKEAMVRQLYECNGPKTACELKKELDSAFRVNPLDMPWISRHYYTPERKLEAKYDGRMVDYQALLKARVQLKDIEHGARRALWRKRDMEVNGGHGRGRARPVRLLRRLRGQRINPFPSK